jgi:hypothetical protein
VRQRLKPASIHIEVWTARTLLTDRGALTPDTPSPGRVLEDMDGPEGSGKEDEKCFYRAT